MEWSRRSLLRLAAEVPASRATNAIVTRSGSAHKSSHEKWATCLVETPAAAAVVVVVEWLYYSKRIIIVSSADLSDFFR